MMEAVQDEARAATADWMVGRLKDFLLSAPEEEIKQVCQGLSSDVIVCVVKLTLTRVIAGISDTSVRPADVAREAVRILGELCRG